MTNKFAKGAIREQMLRLPRLAKRDETMALNLIRQLKIISVGDEENEKEYLVCGMNSLFKLAKTNSFIAHNLARNMLDICKGNKGLLEIYLRGMGYIFKAMAETDIVDASDLAEEIVRKCSFDFQLKKESRDLVKSIIPIAEKHDLILSEHLRSLVGEGRKGQVNRKGQIIPTLNKQ